MLLESEDILNQPADVVYPLVRDEMDKIVPFLPNVERIDQISYDVLDENHIKIVNNWHPKASIPSLVQKFIKPEYLSWKDYATWDNAGYCVEYTIEPYANVSFFSAKGKNYFTPEGEGKTKIRVTTEVTIYPEKIPGVPRLLAKRVLPAVEELIRKMMEPNLTSLSQGLMGYFSNQ